MKKAARLIFIGIFGLLFFGASPALAEEYCFCFDTISNITFENVDEHDQTIIRDICRIVSANDCVDGKKISNHNFDRCLKYPDQILCERATYKWDLDHESQVGAALKAKLGIERKEGQSSFIPSCAFDDKLSDECKDVGIFIILLINIANYLFTIIGGLALLIFIYGGFIFFFSQGSSEQVATGKDAMSAAVIGLVVAFSGYLLINFLGAVIDVNESFRF